MRHKFLRRRKPRNYTVYVRNIPSEYRNNIGLEQFFRQCFSNDSVLQARLKVTTPNLTKTVQKRETAIFNLESAVATQEITGVVPTHMQDANLMTSLVPGVNSGTEVDSIEAYAAEIKKLNKEVTEQIEAIEASMAEYGEQFLSSHRQEDDPQTISLLSRTGEDSMMSVRQEPPVSVTTGDDSGSQQQPQNDDTSTHSSVVGGIVGGLATSVAAGARDVTSGAAKLGSAAVNLVTGDAHDGDFFGGGFVTFTSLSYANAARQMVHHAKPFHMEVRQAPDPHDIFWANVGREHADLQLGSLFSKFATAALCLFWTIPMALVSSISSVEGLKQQFDFVNEAIESFPFLEPVLQQLAPLLLIGINALLPIILEVFSMLEGPVSGSIVVASTFSKLAYFMIIQTFFVSAISGGLLDQLKEIIDNPLSTIDLLANSLPGQSTFFGQLAFVGTVNFVAMENLRVVDLSTALLRRFIGPSLTEKQRQTTFMGIRPLADPRDFEHDSNMAQICVLYFMIVLVYQTIAPVSSFILGFCFLILRPACLHQFVYIYSATPDRCVSSFSPDMA